MQKSENSDSCKGHAASGSDILDEEFCSIGVTEAGAGCPSEPNTLEARANLLRVSSCAVAVSLMLATNSSIAWSPATGSISRLRCSKVSNCRETKRYKSCHRAPPRRQNGSQVKFTSAKARRSGK